jgi:hypothetical protein
MISRRRLFSGIIITLLFSGVIRADMVPASELIGRHQPSRFCGRMEVQHTNLTSPYDSPIVFDFNFGTFQFLPTKVKADVGPSAQIPHTIDLTGGPGSASLCLYALMGLGLFSTPRWIKRLHLGPLPQWYHDGGPFQIGHSFAVSPEILYPVPVDCFVQPGNPSEDSLPRYRLRTVVSCWRKSQFTPETIAARGPPLS